jgi:hypothetical protein
MMDEPHQHFVDLYDIEQRPGAGLRLWTRTVERQLERVREANYRHRLNSHPDSQQAREDADAEEELHGEVYFLALAVRRVILFHDAFAKQTGDPRLARAREAFDADAPNAKRLRDFYEHLDEYLLDSRKKHIKIAGRTAPILKSLWDYDNVVVAFGHLEVDVTVAAVAAIQLGQASNAVWEEHMDAASAKNAPDMPPAEDDGVLRMFEVTIGRTSVIGGDDNPPKVIRGRMLGMHVREATPEEVADRQAREASGDE